MALLQNFYETTLEALKEAKNDRLWFKTNTKLGKLYFDREDYSKLQRILKQLHQSCQVRVKPWFCFVQFSPREDNSKLQPILKLPSILLSERENHHGFVWG